MSIPGLIADHAHDRLDAPALMAPGFQTLTYGRLLSRIDNSVRCLNALGLGRDDRIAIVLSSNVDMAYAFLTVSSAAVCAPLSSSLRAQEYEALFRLMKVKALLTDAALESEAIDAARALNLPLLNILPSAGEIGGVFERSKSDFSIGPPARAGLAQPDDIALILHTSGTTGRPKLVPLTHRNLRQSANDIGEALGLTPSDRCLNVMPVYYIHGLSTIFASLAAGGSVVCAPQFDPTQFFDLMSQYRPTWYSAAPTVHQMILDQADRLPTGAIPRTLRFIRSASSAMPQQMLARIEQTFGAPHIEAYGMTETSPQIASNRLPESQRRAGSVGRAAGPRIAIVDDAGAMAAAFTVGEVVARGANVTQGYLDDPAANKAVFRDGWFRTGDQGYIDQDGFLFLTGRLKEIINRGGEKISPHEIDEVLLRHPAVSQAVAFPIPSARLGEDLAAAVVLRAGTEATSSEIRRFAAARVADYKTPSQILIVDALPTGANGKLQRRTMAAQLGMLFTEEAAPSPQERIAPRTETEAFIRDIWREVLRIEEIGAEDTFSALGGNSLFATLALTRIQNATGVRLSLFDFLETPTVAGLAARMETNHQSLSSVLPPITPRSPGSATPLSSSQQGLWFLDQLYPHSAAYNMHRALRLRGALDIDALDQSIHEIMRRHEALRTVFPADEAGNLEAVIAPLSPAALEHIDLQRLPAGAREAALRKVTALKARARFDLAHGPLLRAKLIQIDSQDFVLLLVTHHIVADGWSFNILLEELAAIYHSIVTGAPHSLPPLTCQFADFALWQQERLQGEHKASLLKYWTERLEGIPSQLALPFDHPRPARPTHQGAKHYFTASQISIEALSELGAQENITSFMFLLAAFCVLLARYSGQKDVVVGSPFANRLTLESESLVGFLNNTLILRVEQEETLSFRRLLGHVRKTVIDASTHQELPFETLVRALQPNRDSQRMALFQVNFRFRNLQAALTGFAGLTAEPMDVDNGAAKFDLACEMTTDERGLSGYIEYSTDLFEPATAQRIASDYQELLALVIANPDITLRELHEAPNAAPENPRR
ncbi:hypothetical protein CCAX7_24960 [Capsulimonas corticalis]|uniref:Uncharacterized protein n=1 Tax=Capsulimonas corticalis TaxID=2219043 RepID=A0A402CVL4_9BACT|nr:condensation domain-containing protein [Capsulimonas corticalis]BDI30445.1 hypothetical protein CCAX7_24960 [Capsulimonas corticalis]